MIKKSIICLNLYDLGEYEFSLIFSLIFSLYFPDSRIVYFEFIISYTTLTELSVFSLGLSSTVFDTFLHRLR